MATTFCTPADFASSTLSGAHGTGVTTIQLATGGRAALKGDSSYPFLFEVHPSATDYTTREVMKATGNGGSADQVVVIRAQENTAEQSWSGGELAEQNPSAKYIRDLNTAVNQVEALSAVFAARNFY